MMDETQYIASAYDLDRLRDILKLPDIQDFQISVQGWYLREDPETGEDRGVIAFPNRSTPRTVSILLEWADASASAALNEILKAEVAGLPFVPVGDVGQDQLMLDLQNFREELAGWERENARGIEQFPDRIGGDERWKQQVFNPLFRGLYPDGTDIGPQFLQGRIIGRAARVSVNALEEANAAFWDDVKENAAQAAKTAVNAASVGIGALVFAAGVFLLITNSQGLRR